MKTFKEFLEQRDAELYNEISFDSIKKFGQNALLGGALLGSALGLGGKAIAQDSPVKKDLNRTTVVQKQTQVKPSSEESIINFEAIKPSVENYANKTLENISTEKGKQFLNTKKGHLEIDGSTIHDQLSGYNLHVYLAKGSTDSKIPQLRIMNIQANNDYIKAKINRDTGKQPLMLKQNNDGTVFFAVTEK